MFNNKAAIRIIAIGLAVLMLGGTVTAIISVFGNM